jgi:hypothetical protein
VIGKPFSDFTRHQCQVRNEELATKNDLNIQIDPEILKVIQASSAISTQKGSSVGLLKIGSKRRRTKAEFEELQREQEMRE